MVSADVSRGTPSTLKIVRHACGTGKKEGFIAQQTCDGEAYLAPLGMAEEEGGRTGRR